MARILDQRLLPNQHICSVLHGDSYNVILHRQISLSTPLLPQVKKKGGDVWG